MKGKVRTWLVCLVLMGGTALLYAPVLHFNFVALDDQLYFDTHIRRGFSWQALRWCFETTRGFLWHPLTWVSHMLDFQFFGANFGWHHATNVALHILSSMLLFSLLRRMTGAFWRSAFVAALFAWHPLHVESVAWIAERKDVLSALFWMLTLWAYIRYAGQRKNLPPPNPDRNPLSAIASQSAIALAKEEATADNRSSSASFFYSLALFFFVLGLMAKPMLVTLPFVFLLLDWWPLARIGKKPGATSKTGRPTVWKPVRALVIEKIPFFVLAIIFCVVTMVAAASRASSLASIPLALRFGNSVVSYFLYVAKTIWPQNMVVLYPFDLRWSAWQIAAACLFIVVVSVAAIRLWNKSPYFLFGWLWYLGVLFPVIGLVQVGVEPMADRYSYLSSIGLFVIVGWGACDLLSGWRPGKVILPILGWTVLLMSAVAAGRQLRYWENSDTLFTHNLKVAPDNYFACAAFAAYYYNSHQIKRAVAESQKSVHLNPDYAFGHTVLGESLLKEGKTGEAVAQFLAALRLDPSAPDARLSYGNALLAQNLPTEAEPQIRKVLGWNPDDPEAHYLLGQAFLQQGDLTGARDQFTRAMSLVQRYSEAQLQLAVVLARQREFKEALENYRQARNVPAAAPDFLVMNNLAWILAASPHPEDRDGAAAVQLATRARDLGQSQPAVIGTLAAAYAEAGRFDEAIATAQQAHDLALAAAGKAHNAAEQKAAKDLADRNSELLELYRSHKAFHETLDFQH